MAADQAPSSSSSSSSSSQKRKRGADDSTSHAAASPTKKLAKTPRKKHDPVQEKRLRRYRPRAPQAFSEVYGRATSQRFFVLSRSRAGSGDEQEETVELAGSTGNIYTVVVARRPTCDCQHARAGNQCKHVLYVLARVLRARYEHVYQLALLGSEVREIFETAGPVPSEKDGGSGGGAREEEDGNRKPIEGECPICYEGLEVGEAIVYCRASCGQNMHKGCLEMWAATKRAQGTVAEVTCPYCRSPWEGDRDMVKKIETTGKVGAEGYRNVADQLGISTVRDTSTYSKWWSGHRSSGSYGGW